MRYIIMLVLCLVTTGAMAGTLYWFFGRLRRIEEERWGSTPDRESLTESLKRFRERRRRKARSGG